MPFPRATAAFVWNETGAGTVLSLFGILICLMLTGLAIDAGNAWRSHEQLRGTADAAAHAGAVALARSGSPSDAVAVAVGVTEINMPSRFWGRILRDPFEDVIALHYDSELNQLSKNGSTNAVLVRVQRSRETGNAVGTLLLKLAGIESWNIAATSAAAVLPTQRCNPMEGVYARGAVTLRGEASVGAGYCLHSQDRVDLAGQVTFAPGAGLSMPDLSACAGNCNAIVTAGFDLAATETNMLMAAAEEEITRLAEGFTDADGEIPERSAFFRTRPRAYDLQPLAEVGVYTKPLRTGDVVRLTPLQFSRIWKFPKGLTYHVSCKDEQNSRLRLDGFGMGLDLSDLVLVTDCGLDLEATVTLRGALLLLTGPEALEAANGALAGDPDARCLSDAASQVYSRAGMHLPPTLTTSNATFFSAGDISVEAGPPGTLLHHRGTAFHAAGEVNFEGGHTFHACNAAPAAVTPSLRLIRQIAPGL